MLRFLLLFSSLFLIQGMQPVVLKHEKKVNEFDPKLDLSMMYWVTSDLDNDKSDLSWKSLHEVLVHTDETEYTLPLIKQPYYEALKYSEMALNDAIGNIVGQIYPKKDVLKSGILGVFDKAEGDKAVEQMNEKGYVIFKNKLSQEKIDTLNEQIQKLEYRTNSVFDNTKRDGSVNFVKDQRDVLKHAPTAIDIMTDPLIMYIVQGYLECEPINTQTNTWWSVAGGVNKDQTQLWHQDFTWVKFVKIFIYLNDVKRQNGPHRYVPGSFKHIQPVLDKFKSYKVSDRISDKEIESMYPNIEHFDGDAGTIIIEDTRGFHSGTHPEEGYRHLLQFEFAVSTYRYKDDSLFKLDICESTLSKDQIVNINTYKRMFKRVNIVKC